MSLIDSLRTVRQRLLGKDHQKATVLILLLLLCGGAAYHSHFILRSEVVFSHLFYIPIALAGFWWGRRGIWVAVLLGATLIVSHLLSGLNVPITNCALRSIMFIAVGLSVGILREQALRSERNLRETRDYLDNLIRYANAPIIVWDREGKITLFNAAFERLTGYRADELIGKPLTAIFNGMTREESLRKIEQTLKGQRWEAVEIPIRCKDGEVRVLLWNSANIYAPDSKALMATIAQGQDITLRKRAEQALNLRVDELEAHGQLMESRLERRIRESAAYERIVDSMLRTLDLDKRLMIGLKEIMDLTRAEKAGVSLVEGDRLVLRKQFGFSEIYLAWASDLAIEEVPSCEEVTVGWNDLPDPSSRLEAALKKERVKRWVTVPLRSEQGFLGILVLASDRPQAFSREQIDTVSALAGSLTLMLEQASLYRTAQERLARLTTLREIDRAISANLSMEGIIEVVLRKVSPHIWVDAVGISLIDWERKRTILARLHLPGDVNIEEEAFSMSDSLLTQLGLEKRPVIIYDVKSDPRVQNHRDIIRKYNLCSYVGVPLVVQDEAIGVLHLFTVEPHQFSQEDLDFFATMAGQAAISVQNARLYELARRYVETLEQQVAERTAELQVALEKAQSADRLKSEFVSNVSHELRTPLANIKLYQSMLRAGMRPDKTEQYWEVLMQETERLKHLVESLLNLSRLEAGQTILNPEPLDLNELAAWTVSNHLGLAQRKGLTLELEPTEGLPVVQADRNQMMQVLSNLIGNAIQYTSEGGRIVLRTGTAVREGKPFVTLSVADTGCGIPSDELPFIFNRFFRGEAARKLKVSGAGLGLSIVKEIVDLHKGYIEVKSEVGQGTTFAIWLAAHAGEVQ